MKRINIKDVGIALLLFMYLSLVALGLMSCGARKSKVDISKEEKKEVVVDNSVLEKKSETNEKNITTTKVDDKNETYLKETIYEWGDSGVIQTPHSGIDKKLPYRKIIREYTQKNNTKSETNADSEIKQNETSKDKKAVKQVVESKTYKKQKETKKEVIPWHYFALAFVLILVIAFLFKKYKDKIWWV